jgi:hypothetical protein
VAVAREVHLDLVVARKVNMRMQLLELQTLAEVVAELIQKILVAALAELVL